MEHNDYPFEFYTPKTSYSTPLNIEIENPNYTGPKEYWPAEKTFMLDDLYEAKAHKWMMENIDVYQGTNVFWCVGRRLNNNEVMTITGGTH